MEYLVSIDFGDNAVQAPHICRSQTDLGLYLERIPSMLGFEQNHTVSVSITTKQSTSTITIKETHLP